MLNPYPPAWFAATRLEQRKRAARQGGTAAVAASASALLFAAYHWWTGIPNMLYAALFGALAMQLYRRTGVLWPAVALHYFADLAALA
ncbi:MAG TPA: CPBP family glutamic-type intramembrane protease [Dongiaceae bacterium]|nr:CPBP family glutamic-type intramembrane protease [Dongiaceae bacterium]